MSIVNDTATILAARTNRVRKGTDDLMHQIVDISNRLHHVEQSAIDSGNTAAAAQIRTAGLELMRSLRLCGGI
jgi:hypothetical protein